MNSSIIQIAYLMLVVSLLVNQDAMAAKIYQWTDEEGVVHFSDVSPSDNTTIEIQEINFISYATKDTDQDEYSIVNQLERMTEWRRQTEEERLARKQLQLEEQRLAQESNSYNLIDSPDTREYYPSAYYPSAYYYSYPGNFGGYNKWHGNHRGGDHWGSGHPGPGHRNPGNFKYKYPNYKSDNYKAF